MRRFLVRRGLKTVHTPVHSLNSLEVRKELLEGINRLNTILESSSANRSILYKSKYKNLPQFVSANDSVRFQKVVRDYMDSNAVNDIKQGNTGQDRSAKLATVGLRLFMDVHGTNLSPLATMLCYELMNHFNKYPVKDTIQGLGIALNHMRTYLKDNKLVLSSNQDIKTLIRKLVHNETDFESAVKVLEELDFNLVSDDVVRVVKGNKTYDEIESTKGCKLHSGILDSNEAYLRSLELPQKKLVSIDEEMCVLTYEGTLREASKILPTLHHLQQIDKKLLLIVTGECVGDALTAITIHNNKCKRQNKKHRTIIVKYYAKDYNGLSLQENTDLQEFLKLPNGVHSIYSPNFSELVPSKVTGNQYYGSVTSLKATTGEAFIYNDELPESLKDKESKLLKQSVTLHIGGYNEFEIEQRRNQMDNLFNNFICHALANGFVPGQGIALCKTIPSLVQLMKSPEISTNLMKRAAINAVISAITQYAEKSLLYATGGSKFEVAEMVAETTRSPDFKSAKVDLNSGEFSDSTNTGHIEPWSTVDDNISKSLNFIQLLSSCNTAISLVLEKPKKK